MPTTFVFEELDSATRDYLLAVRDTEAAGAPGVFVRTHDPLSSYGCFAGFILIIITLVATLTDWFNIIFDDPIRVAMLQTAGLVVGGWLLATRFRGRGVSTKYAGNWIYADPLHLYQAYREQVTISSLDNLVDVKCDHKHAKNGAYEHSTITLVLDNDRIPLKVKDLTQAEQLVAFLSYLTWVYGSEGQTYANLPPATLGGLAKYVAVNGEEPRDAEGNIDIARLNLAIDHIPEEPTREGRSAPAILPYVLVLLGGIVCFFIMKAITTQLRDDAIYEEVMREPAVEPSRLRAYLMDERNTRHRDQVTERLSRCYDLPVAHIKTRAAHPQLREGVLTIFEWLRTSPQPVLSIRVSETQSPPQRDAEKKARANVVAKTFASKVNDTFAAQPWGGPVPPPLGHEWRVPPPPLGYQLVAFVQQPDEAPGAHIEVEYAIQPAALGNYNALVTVRIRSQVDQAPVATGTFPIVNVGTDADFQMINTTGPEPDHFGAGNRIGDALVSQLIGK